MEQENRCRRNDVICCKNYMHTVQPAPLTADDYYLPSKAPLVWCDMCINYVTLLKIHIIQWSRAMTCQTEQLYRIPKVRTAKLITLIAHKCNNLVYHMTSLLFGG